MNGRARYATGMSRAPFVVKYLIKKTGTVLERDFYTIREAQKFANRVKHGRKCELLACPSERW